MKITLNLHAKTSSNISSGFREILVIFPSIWAPKHTPKSPKNRFCEPLASIWHQFGTGRSKLDGFWMLGAQFFIEFGSILVVFLNRSSVAFANNRLMNIMHWYLNSRTHFCLWCKPEPCISLVPHCKCTNYYRKLLQALPWGLSSLPVARRYVRSTWNEEKKWC